MTNPLNPPQYHKHKQPRDIDISLVEFTVFNPLQRRTKVDDLVASLQVEGQLEPVHVVFDASNGRYILADGNRRVTAIRKVLNGTAGTVRAIVYQAQNSSDTMALVSYLFSALNLPKMTLKNGQMLQATLLGGPSFNATVKSSATFLETHFTPDEIAGLVKQGVTPTLLSNAKRIASYTVPGVGKDTPTYFSRVRKTLYWLIRHETQQEAIAYMRLGYSFEQMRNAIDKDQPHLPRMAPPGTKKVSKRAAKEANA